MRTVWGRAGTGAGLIGGAASGRPRSRFAALVWFCGLVVWLQGGAALAQAGAGASPATGASPAASGPGPSPASGSAAESAAQTFIRLCDAAAASNLDPSRPAGVPGNKPPDIKPEIAIPACEAAYAAVPDDPRMAYQLGRSYYAAKRYADALPLYQKAAAGGSVLALHNLGLLYVEGRGANQEEARGIALIQQAAGRGLALSARVMGDYYLLGTHVRKDLAQARVWYDKAATGAGADAYAARFLGFMMLEGQGGPKDERAARAMFQRAADLGEPVGTRALGYMYLNGKGGPQDLQKARGLFLIAAEAGEPSAMNNLGYMYINGLAGPKDLPKARSLFQRGAEGGDAEAMVSLGYMYFNGLGGSKDREKAIYWTRKSAELGNEKAKTNLASYTAPVRRSSGGGSSSGGSTYSAPTFRMPVCMDGSPPNNGMCR